MLLRRRKVKSRSQQTRFVPRVETLERREVFSATPYLVPTAAGVSFAPVLTTGDSVGGFTFGGTPDGLGAFDNGDGTLTLLVGHEYSLSESVGFGHAHNASLSTDADPATNPAGSYIDRLVIRKSDLAVLSGGDQIRTILDGATFAPVTGNALNINRFCSADLAAPTAFFNPATGLGTTERIFLNGEETTGGRGFAHVVTGPNNGTSYTLPLLTGAWENLLANPGSGDTTIVMGNSDGGNNNVYAYVGTKQASGNEIERAGLTNGTAYSVKDNGDGTFSLVTGGTGTVFARPEDGVWDPTSPNDYYFVTTASFGGNSQLWHLHFNDLSNPSAGGTIEVLVNGQNIGKMFDNMTMNDKGQIVLQEDVGGNVRLGKVWMYDTTSHALVELAQSNPALFDPNLLGAGMPGPDFLTQDEESSGAIDVSSILGEGTYLLDMQAHYSNANPALVEGGQLLLMRTGAIAGAGYDAANSNAAALVVLGTSANEHIAVSQNGSDFAVSLGQSSLAAVTTAADRVLLNAYTGNDHVELSEVEVDTYDYLGSGNDRIDGGAGLDRVYGGAGNDSFFLALSDLVLDFSNGNDNRKKK